MWHRSQTPDRADADRAYEQARLELRILLAELRAQLDEIADKRQRLGGDGA